MSRHRLYPVMVLCYFSSVSIAVCEEAGTGFIHPGISHNRAELEFVKSKLKAKEQPWRDAWEKLNSSSYAELSWKPIACTISASSAGNM